MTVRVLVILLFSFFSLYTKGQSKSLRTDTVFASSNHITTILFSEPVTYLAIGSEDFIGTVEGKTVLLKATTSTTTTTSILIKYGANENIYHGAISYAPIPPNSFLDFSDKTLPKNLNPKLAINADSVTISTKMITRRLGIMEGIQRDRIKEIAIKTDGMILSVSDLMRDEDYLFVKILFLNKSKTEYKIDFVDFAYHTPREDRAYQGKDEIKPVPIKGSNDIKLVPVKDEKYLIYAIPKFIMTSKGFMRVSIREFNGSRVLSVDVPYKIIEAAKPF